MPSSLLQVVPNLLTTWDQQCEHNLSTACWQTCYKMREFSVCILHVCKSLSVFKRFCDKSCTKIHHNKYFCSNHHTKVLSLTCYFHFPTRPCDPVSMFQARPRRPRACNRHTDDISRAPRFPVWGCTHMQPCLQKPRDLRRRTWDECVVSNSPPWWARVEEGSLWISRHLVWYMRSAVYP